MKVLRLFLLSVIFTTGISASAGYLQISSQSQLQISREAGDLLIHGIYSIENKGDEPAQNVFPIFFLDQSELTLEGQSVAPGQRISWDLEWRIPLQNLCHDPNEKCSLSLPDRGEFLLRVLNHYQDRNGYPFSVAEHLELMSEESTPMFSANLQIQLKVLSQDPNSFSVNYRIFNAEAKSRQLAIRVLLPKELKLLENHLGSVNIEPHSDFQGSFRIQNETGLPGSEYQIWVTAEWKEGEFRASQAGSQSFRLSAVKSLSKNQIDFQFWGWLAIFAWLGSIAMWIFWIRPLRKI